MASRTKTGIVTSNKMQNTVVVSVESRQTHPLYKKQYLFTKKFYAHTEEEIAEGTKVLIQETKPLSKTKRWIVVETY
ncbi:MAG: 30S ribosomal protein S17 [Sphaerospermopsis sp. SIO1G2]|nr:30S ribosomal protein S17 [Sphaerospermopsis sp. SIO1G2]